MPKKNHDLDRNLAEIYQNDDGQAVNVKTLHIRKKRGWLNLSIRALIILLILVGAAYGAWRYFGPNNNSTALNFSISGPSQVLVNQEFFYTIKYDNLENVAMTNTQIQLVHPDGLIILSANPAPDSASSSTWSFANIDPHRGGEIQIKAKLINQTGVDNITLAQWTYTPANFSSQFKKETSVSTVVSASGLNLDAAGASSILIGQPQNLTVKYSAQNDNYVSAYRLTVAAADNLEILLPDKKTALPEGVSSTEAGVYDVANISNQEQAFPISYRFKAQPEQAQTIKLTFALDNGAGKFLTFKEINLPLDLITNSLNLHLQLNNTDIDQGVNPGDTLNYSLTYNNSGNGAMDNLIIQTVLDSDFLDWASLTDQNHGLADNHIITWTKKEIPQLASLAKDQKGQIDFSIKLMDNPQLTAGQIYEFKNYGQFSLGQDASSSTPAATDSNRSNIITVKINSDLSLSNKLLYFNADNIPVGTGPIPLKAVSPTSLKVYWKLTNSLHDLSNITVSATLPANVAYNAKNQASLGDISYNQATNQVSWTISQLTAAQTSPTAEFSILISPQTDDRNKILVLLGQTQVIATDSLNNTQINLTSKSKTSKLEDDDMVTNNDGLVQ